MSQSNDMRPAVRWVWMALFCLAIGFLGGSSRPDIAQMAGLRPIAALFLIPALYYLSFAQIKQAKTLVALLVLLGVWMAAQLIPLPPSIWHNLPQREVLVELDGLLGLDDEWRPISLVPSRGWNALASLIVPLSALLLALAMRASARMLLLLIAALGALDAVLGLLQVMSGTSSPLYYYALTNHGSAVGIFANENHSAVFSALVLIVIAYLGLTSREHREPVWLRIAYAPAFVFALVAALVSGSRAGFALALLALITAGLIAVLSLSPERSNKRAGKWQAIIHKRPKILLLGAMFLVAGLLGAFIAVDRAQGFADFFNSNSFEDLRWSLFPVLQQMLAAFWGVGVGFGSFEEAYHIFEPTNLLLPLYVNQAHNDWAQLVIEGGFPAVFLLVILLGGISASLLRLFRSGSTAMISAIFFAVSLAILAGASIVDYPLRAPIFQFVATWLLLSLALSRPDAQKARTGPNSL